MYITIKYHFWHSSKLRHSLSSILATNPARKSSSSATPPIDAGTQKEVRHHENHASEWWNQNGTMGALHALNEIRWVNQKSDAFRVLTSNSLQGSLHT